VGGAMGTSAVHDGVAMEEEDAAAGAAAAAPPDYNHWMVRESGWCWE